MKEIKLSGLELYRRFLIDKTITEGQRIFVEAPVFPGDYYYFNISSFGRIPELFDSRTGNKINKILTLNDMFYCNFVIYEGEI